MSSGLVFFWSTATVFMYVAGKVFFWHLPGKCYINNGGDLKRIAPRNKCAKKRWSQFRLVLSGTSLFLLRPTLTGPACRQAGEVNVSVKAEIIPSFNWWNIKSEGWVWLFIRRCDHVTKRTEKSFFSSLCLLGILQRIVNLQVYL